MDQVQRIIKICELCRAGGSGEEGHPRSEQNKAWNYTDLNTKRDVILFLYPRLLVVKGLDGGSAGVRDALLLTLSSKWIHIY